MAEPFFGPWHHIRQCFVILGSDFADGRYLADPGGDPWDLTVRGREWTIGFETWRDGPDEGWEPDTATRETRFEPPEGLSVVLDSRIGMRVICTSLDREINPEQTENPFDFTYPG
jgi:hypothetical protein